MIAVQSSNIEAVDYDDAAEVLTVVFKSGAEWRYYDVPADVYFELIEAPSVGSYFHRNIRSKYEAHSGKVPGIR